MSTTILIIDDTDSNCEALSLNFDALGYAGDQKIIVNSLAEGLKAIRTYPELRVILLDLNLPGVSPEVALDQVYGELRKVGNRQAIPTPMSMFKKEEIEARIAGNRVVVSSPDIMNTITGPKELSKVLETAEAQIQRAELRQEFEALEKKIEKLEEQLSDPMLLMKLINRNVFWQAIALTLIVSNGDTALSILKRVMGTAPSEIPTQVIEPIPRVTITPRQVRPTANPPSPSSSPSESSPSSSSSQKSSSEN